MAEVDGQVVGHVSLIEVGTGPEVDGWELGTGRSAHELAAVSVLFVDPEVGGRGIGSALLAHGAAQARSLGRHPVLDVVSEHVDVIGLYLARGWQVVGEARPVWLPADRAPVLLLHLPQE